MQNNKRKANMTDTKQRQYGTVVYWDIKTKT